jgi:cellulose synthase/poly-beta-1,6-N-acetylglucosamine synthase-like glycosyltransferase
VSALELILFVVSFAIFLFFVSYSLSTFALILLSLYETSLVKIERGELFTPPERLRRPGITIVAPAYNMESVIVACAHSLLDSDYDPLEVILIDDGSEDATTDVLVQAFDLVELPVGDRLLVPTALVTAKYVSRSDPRLILLRKENGGRADAINAGVNVARNELVALVDADTLLEPDALKRIVEVFAADPDNVVGVGGTIRIANGAVIENHTIVEPRVARGGVEASQTNEYLRGFLGGRIAWSRINGLVIISGAFGVFRRDLVRSSGGLSTETLGEDMELVLRLHHQLRPSRPATRLAYAPDANAWTEIPTSLKPLRGQRIRWHVGMFDNLRLHEKMLARQRFGAIGMLALPYMLLFEVVGPVLQIAGYGILGATILLDLVSWWYVAAFFLVTLLVGQLQTAGAILVEETGFRRYRTRDLMMLAGWSLLELFWYRPITAWWRTWATVLVLTGRRPGWGTIPRGTAFHEEPETELVAAPLPR